MNRFVLFCVTISFIVLNKPSFANQAQEEEERAAPDTKGQTHTSTRGIIYREYPDDPQAPFFRTPRNNPIARTPGARVRFGPFISIQVNVDELGNNISGDAANEPSLAIDPTDTEKIVIGWRQFDTVASNFREAGWAYSHDRGRSWVFPGVLEQDMFRSDPVLDSDAEGNFYYYSLTTNSAGDIVCHLFKSVDSGISWQDPVFAYGGDKPWMTVDKTSGIGHGNIYAVWQKIANNYDWNIFTRSTDSGKTFSPPDKVPGLPAFGTIAVGPDGEVYAAGIRMPFFRIFVVAKSLDAKDPNNNAPGFEEKLVNMGGRLWFTDGINNRPNPAGLLGQVWVAVDHSERKSRGNVYVLASVDPPGEDPLDVHFIRSTNSGDSWSRPVRVNDDPKGNMAWQWFGTMSVAPNGRIDTVWNDSRNTGKENISEIYYSYSIDEGKTWSQNIRISPAFDSSIGWPNQQKIGDYYHMISDNSTVSLAYSATFNGEQDIYFLLFGDCNANGIHDSQDILSGASIDFNKDLIPDECVTELD